MNELDLIERIRAASFNRSLCCSGRTSRDHRERSHLVLGIGDDCAIFRPRPGDDLLFTTDQMIEDVHFLRSQPPASIGERALARSLSDITAMGGTPRFCLVALAVPCNHEKWIDAFYRGLLRLARKTETALAGGDLARAEKIYCDVMVCGSVKRGKALRRDGARPGDALFVSGRLGKPWERRIRPKLSLGQSLHRPRHIMHRSERRPIARSAPSLPRLEGRRQPRSCAHRPRLHARPRAPRWRRL